MPRFYFCIGLLMLQGILPVAAFSHGLPASVKQKLQQLAIPESAIGVYAQEIGKHQPIVAVNADAAMNPA